MKKIRLPLVLFLIFSMGFFTQGCYFLVGHHHGSGWHGDDHRRDRHDSRRWSHGNRWDRRHDGRGWPGRH